jgi:hypothetical protein
MKQTNLCLFNSLECQLLKENLYHEVRHICVQTYIYIYELTGYVTKYTQNS